MIQPWFHQAHESELDRIKPLAKLELHECCKRNLVPWRLGRLSLMTRNRIKSIIESHLPNLLSDIWRLMTSCVVLFFKAHGFLLTCNFFIAETYTVFVKISYFDIFTQWSSFQHFISHRPTYFIFPPLQHPLGGWYCNINLIMSVLPNRPEPTFGSLRWSSMSQRLVTSKTPGS